MSFAPMPKFPGSRLLSLPKTRCDEDDECCEDGESIGTTILAAFVQGAAPVLVAYVLHRIFESPEEAEEEAEE